MDATCLISHKDMLAFIAKYGLQTADL